MGNGKLSNLITGCTCNRISICFQKKFIQCNYLDHDDKIYSEGFYIFSPYVIPW